MSIVPCGINYFAAHRFRSQAIVAVGRPFRVPAALVDAFRGGRKREACTALLGTIKEKLVGVVLSSAARDYHTLRLLRCARRLYQGSVELSLKDYCRLTTAFTRNHALISRVLADEDAGAGAASGDDTDDEGEEGEEQNEAVSSAWLERQLRRVASLPDAERREFVAGARAVRGVLADIGGYLNAVRAHGLTARQTFRGGIFTHWWS